MQASTDQATVDIMLPLIIGSNLAVSFTAFGILFVVCQVTWQILFLVVPLGYVFYRYQVRQLAVTVIRTPYHSGTITQNR
jgi:hypothetical protein